MLGFSTFASAPFASTGSGAVIRSDISFVSEAMLFAHGSAIWKAEIELLGTAEITTAGDIVGSGWTRINPDTPEWDIDKSQDWNQIK